MYLNGDRKQRYFSYISQQAAGYYVQLLNNRNLRKSGVQFVVMKQRLLEDENYDGLIFY